MLHAQAQQHQSQRQQHQIQLQQTQQQNDHLQQRETELSAEMQRKEGTHSEKTADSLVFSTLQLQQ